MRKKHLRDINILGHSYKVFAVSADLLPSNTDGIMHWPERVIHVNDALHGEHRFVTIMHEVEHGRQYESGDINVYSDKEQERRCDAFASFVSSLKRQGVFK